MNTLVLKMILTLVAALGLFAGGATLAWKYRSAEIAAKTDRIEQLAEAVHQLQAAEARNTKVMAEARERRLALQHALDAVRDKLQEQLVQNRAWADEPVPKGVQDALRQ